MNSLFTVNNNISVSLLSVTVTPSTFLAALIVLLTFGSLYLSFYLGPLTASVTLLTAPIRRIFPSRRPPPKPASTAPVTIPLALGPDIAAHRPLPALPPPEQNDDRALVRASRRSSRHARSSRSVRSAHSGLRADDTSPLRLPEPPLGVPRRRNDRRGERARVAGSGFSLSRWLQSSGVAPTRKRT